MAQEIIEVEKEARKSSGMFMLVLNTALMLASVAALVRGSILAEKGDALTISVILIVAGLVYPCLIAPILYYGLKVLKPNEALVLTFFGTYYGTLKGPGFFFVNPFVTGTAPASNKPSTGSIGGTDGAQSIKVGNVNIPTSAMRSTASKKISLKALTLNNDKQKINDALGNPIIIGIVVVWKVVNSAKAVFNVDNYTEYLSIQCDSALRNIVRRYPYDAADDDNEKSLRGSSQEIAESLKTEIQMKVELAGLEIVEARITHLSYAPEIAQAMLQKQQASAVVAARQLIVEGAVGMVEMALAKLSANNIVDLDEERKAAMVSNLLVVLCGNKEAQPIVNSGTIY